MMTDTYSAGIASYIRFSSAAQADRQGSGNNINHRTGSDWFGASLDMGSSSAAWRGWSQHGTSLIGCSSSGRERQMLTVGSSSTHRGFHWTANIELINWRAPSRGVVSQLCSSVISGWPGMDTIALGSPSSFAVMESSWTCANVQPKMSLNLHRHLGQQEHTAVPVH